MHLHIPSDKCDRNLAFLYDKTYSKEKPVFGNKYIRIENLDIKLCHLFIIKLISLFVNFDRQFF